MEPGQTVTPGGDPKPNNDNTAQPSGQQPASPAPSPGGQAQQTGNDEPTSPPADQTAPNQPPAPQPPQQTQQPSQPQQQPPSRPPTQAPETDQDQVSSAATPQPEPPAQPTGNQLFSWEASEYLDQNKNSLWYITLGVITLVLAVVLIWVFQEILSAIVVVLMAIALVVYGRRSPRVLRYALNESGITVGDKFYVFEDFKSYAVVQDGGLTMIELDPVKRFMPRLSIFFDPADADEIISILDRFLPRTERAPDAIDQLSRKLKF